MCSGPFFLTEQCAGWARLARYEWNTAEGWLRRPGEEGYVVQAHPAGRVELLQLAEDGTRERVLYAADAEVLERYLFGLVLGDDIRDDVDLPYLDLPSGEADTADGYRLGPAVTGSRTLYRGTEPVAAAPGGRASLAALVPLSHFLGCTLADLRRSYLNEHGAPLLAGGRYSRR